MKRCLPSLQSHSRSTFSPSRPFPSKTPSKVSLLDDIIHLSYSEEDSFVARSKQRVEDLGKVRGQDSDTSSGLRRQLAARDWYIDVLKEKLIEARVAAKSLESESASAKERTVAQLTKERTELAKTVQVLEIENLKLLQRVYTEDSTATESPTTVEVSSLRSRVAELTGEIAAKDIFVSSMKEDLGQLSDIVSGMTTLNTELNVKIARLTLDMEDKEKRCYQALAKAQHVDELEKTLVEVMGERQRLETQVHKLTENSHRLMDMTEAAIDLQSAFASLESRLTPDFAMQVDHIKGLLSHFDTGKLRKSSDLDTLKHKAKQTELELRAANRELARAAMTESTLRTRLSTLESEREGLKSDMEVALGSLKATIALLQTGFNKFGERYDVLKEEYERMNSEGNKMAVKVAALQGKLEGAVAAAGQAMKAEGRAMIALREAQIQLSAAKAVKTSAEAALQVREQHVRDEAARLKVVSEELWRRDTFILKKSGQILSLQDQLRTFQALLLQAQLKAKATPATTNRGNKSSDSRGRFTPVPQRSGGELHKVRARAHQSKSMVFNRLPLELLTTDKQRILLETLSKALGLYESMRSGGEVDLSVLEEILEGAGTSENRLDLIKVKVRGMVGELEGLLKGVTDGVPVGWVAESLRRKLDVGSEDTVQPGKLAVAVKEAVEDILQ